MNGIKGVAIKPMEDPYSSQVFDLTKAELFPFVDEVFGWDDAFQKQRMMDDYKPHWFYWLEFEKEEIGYLCFKRYDQAIHIHLLILKPQWQNRGYGRKVMEFIHSMARLEQRDITLSSFKINTKAVSLYRSLGYHLSGEEEHFLLFRKSFEGVDV
ncbi:GNAT family N-acetyltransferase [Reinekea marina]|uniref:GNAT family N-acetyltransferase n=1 Tax=Reinekea marina TaxID=1310421 RepID=A0ABV7WS26_9GAMM|nr:GNAT family N-acetyltransferase [Reinekea marina]MDN3648560.1 GNAT family N-acetyltransferase [Reinekea marina]